MYYKHKYTSIIMEIDIPFCRVVMSNCLVLGKNTL